MCPPKHISEIRKIPAGTGIYLHKTRKIMSKRKQSKSGLSVKEELNLLDTHISIAKGNLATLSLGHKSGWMRKLSKMEPEHLRILLSDTMEEIWSAQAVIDRLRAPTQTPRLIV